MKPQTEIDCAFIALGMPIDGYQELTGAGAVSVGTNRGMTPLGCKYCRTWIHVAKHLNSVAGPLKILIWIPGWHCSC